jgi:hypothetical protein
MRKESIPLKEPRKHICRVALQWPAFFAKQIEWKWNRSERKEDHVVLLWFRVCSITVLDQSVE